MPDSYTECKIELSVKSVMYTYTILSECSSTTGISGGVLFMEFSVPIQPDQTETRCVIAEIGHSDLITGMADQHGVAHLYMRQGGYIKHTEMMPVVGSNQCAEIRADDETLKHIPEY